jgi:hypothetical protein
MIEWNVHKRFNLQFDRCLAAKEMTVKIPDTLVSGAYCQFFIGNPVQELVYSQMIFSMRKRQIISTF